MPDAQHRSSPRLTPQHAELLVLSVLAEAPSYGYAIAKHITARSADTFKLPPSQLYPLMTRLEKQGLVAPSWEEVKADASDDDAPGRRRKWYKLSAKGRKRLAQRVEAHRRFTALIDAFIPTEPQPGGAS
ncbi:MAG: helix-turn-helix transcriptional regulator [Planctomycetota bacterium]